MRRLIPLIALIALLAPLLALGGCVAYPAPPVYAEAAPAYVAPAPVYVAPPSVYVGGTFGFWRPYRGHWGHRGWR